MAFFSAALPLLLLFLSVSSLSVNGNAESLGECSTVILTLTKCLSFVMIGSEIVTPDPMCCSGFKTVHDTKAECLCKVLKNGEDAFGYILNTTKAATLPAACKINDPSTSACLLSTKPPPSAPAPVPAAGPQNGSRPGSSSAPVPAAGPQNGSQPGSSSAPVPAAGPQNGSLPDSSSAPAPSPSHSNHGSSISVLSFAISGALVILFARV